MNGQGTPRTRVDLDLDTRKRLMLQERRLPSPPTRLRTFGTGTTSERDAYYGAPATDAERVALANLRPVWFNTDLGWEESYYAETGLAGLTARGLMAGTASGWYPTGPGPWIVMEPSTTFGATTGAYTGNWNGTVRKNDPLGTYFGAQPTYLSCHLPGYYDIGAWTTQTTGSGTADWVLRHLNQSGGTNVRQQHAAGPALNGSYWTRVNARMEREPMLASHRVTLLCGTGALSIHNGGGQSVRGQMYATYVGPLLVSN